MTKSEAKKTIVEIIDVAMQRGLFNLGTAKTAIQALDVFLIEDEEKEAGSDNEKK